MFEDVKEALAVEGMPVAICTVQQASSAFELHPASY